MTTLAWLTDLHLNFLSRERANQFIDSLNQQPADVFLMSGDLSESHYLESVLSTIGQRVQKPFYFVCGNHDYYRSSVSAVRAALPQWIRPWSSLTWLSAEGVIELSPTAGLVGHDGWGDGRYGVYHNSPVILNDFIHIAELHYPLQEDRLISLQALGDEAGAHLRATLPDALERYEQVFVVTHVPPYPEVCMYRGQITEPHVLPFYACKATGDALSEMAMAYPHRQITVLSGHTHSAADQYILPNLRVLVGQAEYEYPTVQPVMFEV